MEFEIFGGTQCFYATSSEGAMKTGGGVASHSGVLPIIQEAFPGIFSEEEYEALLTKARGDFVVLWRDAFPEELHNAVIAHEMGHVSHQHVGAIVPAIEEAIRKCGLEAVREYARNAPKGDPESFRKETEADSYAARRVGWGKILQVQEHVLSLPHWRGIELPEAMQDRLALTREKARWFPD